MKYLDKSFSSRPASDAYREAWERIFGSDAAARQALGPPKEGEPGDAEKAPKADE